MCSIFLDMSGDGWLHHLEQTSKKKKQLIYESCSDIKKLSGFGRGETFTIVFEKTRRNESWHYLETS